MAGIRIEVDDYKDLQKQMKGVDKAARLALRKRIREAGKPLAAQITEGGGSEMPQTGGAQESYLGAKATLSQTMSSLRILYNKKGPQVRIPNRAGFIRQSHMASRAQPIATLARLGCQLARVRRLVCHLPRWRFARPLCPSCTASPTHPHFG